MTNKRDKVIISILGFFVLAIPLIFLCQNVNREFLFTKARVEEDLKEKILDSANKVERNLNLQNYLQSEFNSIHAKLFPDCPDEVIQGIPEKSFTQNLYSKEKFKELVSLTKNKFSPIIITYGNDDIETVTAYFSPELEKDIIKESEKILSDEIISYLIKKISSVLVTKKYKAYFFTKFKEIIIEIEKQKLLKGKSYFDTESLNNKYQQLYNSYKKNIFLNNELKVKKITDFGLKYYLDPCYKYISRFCSYNRFDVLFTEYYGKQNLYHILKHSISKNGIHGFYTCLIPQNHIDPQTILDSTIESQNSNNTTKIEVEKSLTEAGFINSNKGLEYRLNIPGFFINHINIYKAINGINKTYIMNNQIKITADYPKDFLFYKQINLITKIISIAILLLYILFSFTTVNKTSSTYIQLSNKLILILCILLLLPISAIGLLNIIISKNLSEVLNLNMYKTLHNKLENFALFDKELYYKHFSTIIEFKKIIKKFDINLLFKSNPDTIPFFKKTSLPKWYKDFISDFYILPENKDLYVYDEYGISLLNREKGENQKIEVNKILLTKYFKNLGFCKNNSNFFKENKENFTISIMENYIDLKDEEEVIGQESIPNKDLLSFKVLDKAIYSYAQDKNNNNVLLYTKMSDKNGRRYNYLHPYMDKYPLCFSPYSKYAFIKMAITFKRDFSHKIRQQFPPNISDKEVKNLLKKALDYNDSGKEKNKISNQNIIKEWLCFNDSVFIIAGIAQEKNYGFFKLIISMIFPFLLLYTILLIIAIKGFITNFIDKPISIFKEGLKKLENNIFGSTIESFSNDEFNDITLAFNEMSIAIKQKEQMKRYVSDRLVKSVEKNKIQKAGDSKQEKVTILTSDIRNFTGTSEKYEPSEIVEMLNSYFTKMQEAISDNYGIIDKYIGDAIQAVFYDEPDKENQVIRASKAALAMRKALNRFNKERKSKGLFTIENGIGIDTDFAITGTIGTQNGRKDFSVNGEVINRAAELEAKTKMTQSKILISKKSLEFEDPFSQPIGCQLPQQQSFEGASLAVPQIKNCPKKAETSSLVETQTKNCPQEVGGSGFGVAKDERGLLISNDGNNTDDSDKLSLNKVYSNSVTTPTCYKQVTSPQGEALEQSSTIHSDNPQGEALETTNHIPPITNHQSPTTHHSEAQASHPIPSSLYPKILIATQSSTARPYRINNDGSNSNNDNDNKTNHTLYQSHLVFKIFDEDSVELIDVRE